MMQYVLWAVSFIGLWITLVWLNVLVLEPQSQPRIPRKLPKVTIVLPCFNKSGFMEKTVESLSRLNYPQKLIQYIIVDDCSTDSTLAEAMRLQKKYSHLDINVFAHEQNKGKAGALNTALAQSKGDFFACLDADTSVHPDSLLRIVRHFSQDSVAAVISQVKVDSPKNVYERFQRVEYIVSNFIRRMMSNLGTLCLTPGVLSAYRTDVLKKISGFAEGGLTEDLEIAMRLRNNGYEIIMEPEAVTYTSVPRKWRALWRQRIRWYRGFCFNHFTYRRMLFSKKHGLYGLFQMPLNIAAIIMLLTSVLLISYQGLHDLYEFLYRSLTIKGYLVNHVLELPTLKELVLGQNIQIIIPVIIASLLGFYLFYRAHLKFKENIFSHLPVVVTYVFVAPYITTMHWLSALVQEALRVRRKW